MPNVRDFHDPAFRARANTDAIVSVVMAGKGQMPAFGEQPQRARRCRRCRATSGAWARQARLREPRRDECGEAAIALAAVCFCLGASGAAFAKSKKHKHRTHKSHHRTASTRRAAPTAEGRAHLKRANALAGEGDCQAAIDEYTKAYELLDDPVVLFNRGECFRRIGDAEPPIDDYREFLEKVPNAPNRADIEAKIAALEAPEPPRARRRRSRSRRAGREHRRRQSRRHAAAVAKAAAAAERRRSRGTATARRPTPEPKVKRRGPRRRRWRSQPDRPSPSARAPPADAGAQAAPAPGSGSRWRSWRSARPSAATWCFARTISRRRTRRWATTGSERAPRAVIPRATRGPGRGRRRLARRRRLPARRFDPAGRGGRRSDADAGAAVGDGDGGRRSHAPSWCRPRPTTISLPTSFTVELDRSITGPVTIAIDALDDGGYVLASGTTTQTHINTGGTDDHRR